MNDVEPTTVGFIDSFHAIFGISSGQRLHAEWIRSSSSFRPATFCREMLNESTSRNTRPSELPALPSTTSEGIGRSRRRNKRVAIAVATDPSAKTQ